MPVGRALISVSDKTGLVEFAHRLNQLGIEIISTGGTWKILESAGVTAIEVSNYTGFPEMLDGRIKTLHPKIFGGILGRQGLDEAVLAEHDIGPIDLVVVNLYPFAATVSRPDCHFELAIENIDIGGPSLVRAAAKNHQRTAVIVDPNDYGRFLDALGDNQVALSAQFKLELAAKAFAHTAMYDATIAAYMDGFVNPATRYPTVFQSPSYTKVQDLRYGENPHQQAAFYRSHSPPPQSLGAATQIQGKALSYNNIADSDAALECALSFDEPGCVIVKHGNPCGVALATDLRSAYERANATDPTSAFGGIIAFNRALDAETAQAILDRQFVEVIIASGIDADAENVLAKKPDIRVLSIAAKCEVATINPTFDFKAVSGGLLVQDHDMGRVRLEDLKAVTERVPTASQLRDLLFAWQVVKFVKSNAVVYAGNGRTLGIGGGQTSRVHSARIGVQKAQDHALDLRGAVVASDAFFPFRDSVDEAAAAGIAAIVQPGGSIRDAEVISAANAHGIAMVFTGMRHFRH